MPKKFIGSYFLQVIEHDKNYLAVKIIDQVGRDHVLVEDGSYAFFDENEEPTVEYDNGFVQIKPISEIIAGNHLFFWNRGEALKWIKSRMGIKA